METHHILDRLRTAFDPLGVLSSQNLPQKSSPKTAEAASILGMADLVNFTKKIKLMEMIFELLKLSPFVDECLI